MVDTANIFAWCWDARPYPFFPARTDVWGDSDNWRLGHWLNGRLGSVLLPDLVSIGLRRTGFLGLRRLQPLRPRHRLRHHRHDQRARCAHAARPRLSFRRGGKRRHHQVPDARAHAVGQARAKTISPSPTMRPVTASPSPAPRKPICPSPRASPISMPMPITARRWREARRLVGASDRVAQSALPLVLDQGQAIGIGARLLQDAWVGRETRPSRCRRRSSRSMRPTRSCSPRPGAIAACASPRSTMPAPAPIAGHRHRSVDL